MRNYALKESDIDWVIKNENPKNLHIIGSHGGEIFMNPYHDFGDDKNDIPQVKEQILLKFNKHYRVHHQNH